MCSKKLKATLAILVEICILTALLVCTKNFYTLWGPITQRGFFCDDETLKYPYREDTVTPRLEYIIGLYAPLAVICFIAISKCLIKCLKLYENVDESKLKLLLNAVQTLYESLKIFLFGYVALSLLKNLSKCLLGRLRPHFFAVCQPQLSDGTNCSAASNHGVYIEHYTCMGGENVSADMLWDVHASFPSGHSSLTFYGMVFTALYLQMQLRYVRSHLAVLQYAMQLFCLLLALFVAISRLVDYKHHWSDVLAGSLLGATIASLAILQLHITQKQQHRIFLKRQCAAEQYGKNLNITHTPGMTAEKQPYDQKDLYVITTM